MARDVVWEEIWDFDNFEISDAGTVRNKKTGRILKPTITPNGFKRVTLKQDGRCTTRYVHYLVAEAFFEGVDECCLVYPADGNGLNTDMHNLCISEGRVEKRRFGRIKRIDTGEIFDNVTECSTKLGIPRATLYRCLREEKPYKGLDFVEIP